MYGLPIDIDLGFFSARTLIQVCIGAHDLILNFDGGVSVTVMSCIGVAGFKGTIRRHEDFRQAASVLVTLIDRTVASAQREGAGTLHLTFQGGGTLLIYDDTNEYESYVVTNGGQLLVV